MPQFLEFHLNWTHFGIKPFCCLDWCTNWHSLLLRLHILLSSCTGWRNGFSQRYPFCIGSIMMNKTQLCILYGEMFFFYYYYLFIIAQREEEIFIYLPETTFAISVHLLPNIFWACRSPWLLDYSHIQQRVNAYLNSKCKGYFSVSLLSSNKSRKKGLAVLGIGFPSLQT